MTISAAYLGTATAVTKVVSLHFEPAERIGGDKVMQNAWANFTTTTDLSGTVVASDRVSVSGYFDPPRAHGWEMPLDHGSRPNLRERIIVAAKAVLP